MTLVSLSLAPVLVTGCAKPETTSHRQGLAGSGNAEGKGATGDQQCGGAQDGAGLVCDQGYGGDDQTQETATDGDGSDTDPVVGLPDTCTFAKSDGGGSITCIPRELPLTRNFALKGAFDPEKACKYDIETLTCDIGADEPLVIALDEPTKDEQFYTKLPDIITIAKLVLAPKLEGDAKKKDLVFGALDIVAKYRKELFTLGDMKAALDELEALVKKAKPDLAQDKLTEMRTQIEAVIAQLKAKRDGGTAVDLDVAAVVAAFGTKLPPDVLGGLTGGDLDLVKLLELLAGGATTATGPGTDGDAAAGDGAN
jgi:hypothetical protein